MQLLFDPRTKKILFGLWCLAWPIIALLLLAPLSNPIEMSYSDLIAHFLIFACLAFTTVGFSHRGTELTLLAGATVAGGVALEFAQGLVPYRTFDILDMGANALGTMVGYAGALTVLLLVIRPAAEERARAAADA
jgi:glycopeptide antibiotics resistance protein